MANWWRFGGVTQMDTILGRLVTHRNDDYDDETRNSEILRYYDFICAVIRFIQKCKLITIFLE